MTGAARSATVEDLHRLNEALNTFAAEAPDLMDQIRRRAEEMRATFAGAHEFCNARLRLWLEEEREADRALAWCRGVENADCTLQYQRLDRARRAVSDCEAQIARLRRVRENFEMECHAHERCAERLRAALDTELPRSCTMLRGLVAGITGYAALSGVGSLPSSARGSSAARPAGVAERDYLKGDASEAVIRKSLPSNFDLMRLSELSPGAAELSKAEQLKFTDAERADIANDLHLLGTRVLPARAASLPLTDPKLAAVQDRYLVKGISARRNPEGLWDLDGGRHRVLVALDLGLKHLPVRTGL